MPSKKNTVLLDLYQACKEKNNFVFDNNLVKSFCGKHGFGNPFDVTKIDSSKKLPTDFKNKISLIHLGNGKHQFVHANIYHPFEFPIQEQVEWKYKKSLLNEYNSSESNILSVANNQRILHDFLFGKDLEFQNLSIESRPKTYFPHRTKTSFQYLLRKERVAVQNLQLEIDLTIEYKGIVGIFEAKNGKPMDFNICQLYHPFLYYRNSKLDIKEIQCIYLVRKDDSIKLWSYIFKDSSKINSICLKKSKEYILERI